eukprot:CAMPEP_0180222792 /NCGR_PEP_ID=MMETSP0987-20121128/20976_1 /TAXON_ID=697907 /ORGANISM="non described non described, Strain CCMP2293" /LENGTH=222 /DNA_ID=CAMNT_0022185057 /DNA_START=21 /DNA_END=689 /DNA_ORIENTATION=-
MTGKRVVVGVVACVACLAALLNTRTSGLLTFGWRTELLSGESSSVKGARQGQAVRQATSELRRQVRTPQRERSAGYRRAGESRYVHRTRVTALAVPTEEPFKMKGREEQLVEWDEDGAEKARCKGLLHACQSWLGLQDGVSNSIVITAPDDSGKQLIDQDVILPASGSLAIPDKTWTLLVSSCKYGLSDLKGCSKPERWPVCTGEGCKAAAKADVARPEPES